MQSAYLCVIFHPKHKKYPFLAVLTWFLILGKIQDGGQDGDHCWWRHRPPAAPLPIKYTSSCREDQGLSTKGKIVKKYCNISKTPGRGFHPPSPPPVTTVGVWICLYVRGLKRYVVKWTEFPLSGTLGISNTVIQQEKLVMTEITSRNRRRNRYRNCDRSGSLKLYPSGVFVCLKHVCSRKQPHPLQKTWEDKLLLTLFCGAYCIQYGLTCIRRNTV